jgi:hypothetical protein
MNDDLLECITTLKRARDELLARTMSVREANAVSAANHAIISAYALDLRERIFIGEQAQFTENRTQLDVGTTNPNRDRTSARKKAAG